MHIHYKIPLKSTNRFGFRLSIIDIALLITTALVTYFFPKNFLDITILNDFLHYFIPYLICNFFLFCNVFRIKTKYELCWLGIASMNMIVTIGYGYLLPFFVIQSVFTVIAISLEIRSKTYHGIFSNPNK